MPVAEELKGEQAREQRHEKGRWSQCSLKVTRVLQQKNKKRIFSFPTFLCHYRHRVDQVLAKRKLLFWGFFFKIPWCLRGGLSSEA